jgi:hypothetical protein
VGGEHEGVNRVEGDLIRDGLLGGGGEGEDMGWVRRLLGGCTEGNRQRLR